MTIRRIGEIRTPGIIAPSGGGDRETVAVYTMDALCEALDEAPDEAQFLLFIKRDGEQFVYWGETQAGPWQVLDLPAVPV